MKLFPFFSWTFLRFLLIGGWNTLFGVGLYTVVYRFYGEHVHYLLLTVPVQFLAITQAFLCYKFLVFRVRQTAWFAEYLRCFLIYGLSALLTTALLWLCVSGLNLSPILGNLAATAIVTLVSFLGHQAFTFRRKLTSKGDLNEHF